MKSIEAAALKGDIIYQITTKGIPIDIRNGSNEKIAEWVGKVFDNNVQIDKPLGTVQGTDFDHCPRCNGIIGQSAFYCKRCGARIREGGA